ncbi:MAG TPA: hypothetical protein VMZ50_02260 [Phycisphaerae bacterium]|nr:hypothetical protein [Phycisphaerae bacterium]
MAEPDKKTEDLENVYIIGQAPVSNEGDPMPPEVDEDYGRQDRPDEFHEVGMTGDPSNTATNYDRTQTSFDLPHREADSITGTFDAFAANVDKVFYGDTEGVTGKVQAIQYSRCGVDYDTNNWPKSYTAPTAWSQTQEQIGIALPFPARHDQEEYHVAVDDIVMVLEGRDGRRWFLSDELPFIGTVEGAGTNTGSGDGLTSVKVRRQYIAGDPTALELGDLLDADGTEIDYADVWIVDENGADQVYETDDRILVHRRGAFLFAAPKAPAADFEMLYCKIVTPASLAGEVRFSTANPCDIDGGNVVAGTTLYIYHKWQYNITTSQMTTIPHLSADDIVPYLPFEYDPADDTVMEDCGILLGEWCLPDGAITAADEKKPLQLNATGQIVVDWLYARTP